MAVIYDKGKITCQHHARNEWVQLVSYVRIRLLITMRQTEKEKRCGLHKTDQLG